MRKASSGRADRMIMLPDAITASSHSGNSQPMSGVNKNMRPGLGILKAVERRCVRSAAGVHDDLAQQLNGLASVASTAFFFGIFGNVVGIVYSFRGGGGEKSTVMAAV